MSAESPSRFSASRRNITVTTALWILGAIALLEVFLALVALAPRFFSKRLPVAAAEQPVTPVAQQQSADITPPLAKPFAPSPLKDQLLQGTGEKGADTPFRSPSVDTPVPGGASLGIVNSSLENLGEGGRKLLVSIKALRRDPVDVPQVKVQVYFYDDQEGEISPSKAQVTSSWMSLPVEWKEGGPELLEVKYLPDSIDPRTKFAGYVVAVYYKGDLQDYRAEPSRLSKLFPLKYYIGLDE